MPRLKLIIWMSAMALVCAHSAYAGKSLSQGESSHIVDVMTDNVDIPLLQPAGDGMAANLATAPVQIFFQQASCDFNPGFNENGVHLKRFTEMVRRILAANPSAVYTIEVRSACSPEGRAVTNWTLSDGRAHGVASYIKEHSGLPGIDADSDKLLLIESVGADWDGFYKLVKAHASEIEHADEALEIMERFPMKGRDVQAHNNRLACFDTLRRRSVWDNLADRFFVELRQTTVRAVFSLPQDAVATTPAEKTAEETVEEPVQVPNEEPVQMPVEETVEETVEEPVGETAAASAPTALQPSAQQTVDTFDAVKVDAVIETAVDSSPSDRETKADSMVLSSVGLQVYFHQSRYDLDADYHDNGQRLKEFVETINSIVSDPGMKFQRVEIRSSCSPEGSAGFNWQLSSDRANVVGDYLKTNYGISDEVIEIESVGTDWNGLYELILRDEASIEHADEARAIIENNPMSSRRDASAHSRRLELFNTLYNRSVWDNLHERYFPDLRTTTATAYFYEPFTRETGISSFRLLPVQSLSVSPSADSIIRLEPQLLQITEPGREPLLSVKTNLLYDAFFWPGMGYQPILNIELEYYFRHNKHWTVLGEYEFPWWVNDSKYNYFQMLNWQLEGRRYFKADGTHTGHYLSVYGHYNLYDFCMNSSTGSGAQGEGFGAGLGYGYVLQLPWGNSDRWKLEFFLKCGYYESLYDNYDASTPYQGKYYYRWYNDPEDFIRRNNRFRWFGPTGVGVTLSYDLLYRNIH